MPRGVAPRQPARTGRQDKVRVGTGAIARPGRGKASAPAPKGRQKPIGKKAMAKPTTAAIAKIKGYNPIAPERVAEILICRLQPIQERYRQVIADPSYVDSVLAD